MIFMSHVIVPLRSRALARGANKVKYFFFEKILTSIMWR